MERTTIELDREQPVKSSTISSPIGFISRRDGVDHIYLMDADGANVRQLTTGPYRESSFAWSPDGKKIAFWRNYDGEGIYTMNADGTNVVRLSPSPGFDIFPHWSPDGLRLVFTKVIRPSSPHQLAITQIMIMNADGTNRHVVIANNQFNMEPRWSPDGAKILFMSTLGRDGVQIYTMSPTGTNFSKLTASGTNGDPAWSPDGTKIAFGSDREGGGKLNIFTMNATGSDVQQLTHFSPPIEAGDTGWSPDGTKIAFEWDINGHKQSDPTAHAEVWIMNADGTNQAPTGQLCSGVGACPRWRPNLVNK
jgi:TolB protein